MERNAKDTEIIIDLDLAVDVWFGYRDGHDISVAVVQDGANPIVTRHFTWDELYDAMDYEEPLESLKEQAVLEISNHRKGLLKRMVQFAKQKGFQRSGQKEKRITVRTQKPQLLRIVSGAIKACIDAHGPITHEWSGSAAKRIVSQFLASEALDTK